MTNAENNKETIKYAINAFKVFDQILVIADKGVVTGTELVRNELRRPMSMTF